MENQGNYIRYTPPQFDTIEKYKQALKPKLRFNIDEFYFKDQSEKVTAKQII